MEEARNLTTLNRFYFILHKKNGLYFVTLRKLRSNCINFYSMAETCMSTILTNLKNSCQVMKSLMILRAKDMRI